MCEFSEIETDEGSQFSFLDEPASSDFSQETDIPENVIGNEDTGQIEGQESFFEDDIPEDTYSDFEKINHSNMTLEDVQEIQGMDENGNMTGEGTGNEAFIDSLPEDYEQSGDRFEPGATMSHDEFIAEQDRFEADVNGSARAKIAGMPDDTEIAGENIDDDDKQKIISRNIER